MSNAKKLRMMYSFDDNYPPDHRESATHHVDVMLPTIVFI